jgi:transposase
MTITNAHEPSETICSTKKRRRWTPYEKQQIVNLTYHPCVSVSLLHENMVYPHSQLLTWRMTMESGGLTAVVRAPFIAQSHKAHIT